MIELIKKQLNNDEIIGIIPINPKRLRMKFANKSFAPGFGQWIIFFLIIFFPALFLFGFFGFILGDLGVSKYSLIILFILITGGLMFFAENIYVNKIKKYPQTILALTNKHLYFLAIKKEKIGLTYKFDTKIDNLSKVFYGEINKKTQHIGESFHIIENDKILLSGKLLLKNDQFICETEFTDFLFPIDKLKNIYLS